MIVVLNSGTIIISFDKMITNWYVKIMLRISDTNRFSLKTKKAAFRQPFFKKTLKKKTIVKAA